MLYVCIYIVLNLRFFPIIALKAFQVCCQQVFEWKFYKTLSSLSRNQKCNPK